MAKPHDQYRYRVRVRGKLTALRYPERELVSVPALHTYYESAKPFLAEETSAPALTAQQQLDDLLDIEDVIGKRIINTQFGKRTPSPHWRL